MTLSKHIDHSTAQPRIPREQVPTMAEWLKRHNRPEPKGLARWWRR
jgi:hypothetical protein